MATLSLLSNFSLPSLGNTYTGKQGATTADFDEALDITVTGTAHIVSGSLTTATIVTVYDDDNDVPADWDYAYFWADQDLYIQIIGSGTNVILKIEATVPFWLPGFDAMLAAADTTAIAGGTEPTLTDIDSIVLGNYTGTTASYMCAFID